MWGNESRQPVVTSLLLRCFLPCVEFCHDQAWICYKLVPAQVGKMPHTSGSRPILPPVLASAPALSRAPATVEVSRVSAESPQEFPARGRTTGSSKRPPPGGPQQRRPGKAAKKASSTVTCRSGHQMTLMTTMEDGWSCGLCGQAFSRSTTLFDCSACNYNLCRDCCKLQTEEAATAGSKAAQPLSAAGAGGGAICEHGRQRPICEECKHAGVGGSSICEHSRPKSKCKECKQAGVGGVSICEHDRSSEST